MKWGEEKDITPLSWEGRIAFSYEFLSPLIGRERAKECLFRFFGEDVKSIVENRKNLPRGDKKRINSLVLELIALSPKERKKRLGTSPEVISSKDVLIPLWTVVRETLPTMRGKTKRRTKEVLASVFGEELVLASYLRTRNKVLHKPTLYELDQEGREFCRLLWGDDKCEVGLRTLLATFPLHKKKKYTPRELILLTCLYRLEKGNIPSFFDLIGQKNISFLHFSEYWESYNQFLLRIGCLPRHPKGKQEVVVNLLLNYLLAKELHDEVEGGDDPLRMEEVKKYGECGSPLCYYRVWGSYRNFLSFLTTPSPERDFLLSKAIERRKEMGRDLVLVLSPIRELEELRLGIEELRKRNKYPYPFLQALEYLSLRTLLLRKPYLEEFSDGERVIDTWRSYDNLILFAEGGEKEPLSFHTKDEIRRLVSVLSLDRKLSFLGITPEDLGKVGVEKEEVEELWGSWEEFERSELRNLVSPKRIGGLPSREELVKEYMRVRGKLRRTPTKEELEEISIYPLSYYLSLWRTYPNLVWAMEGESASEEILPRREKEKRKRYLERYIEFLEERGRPPQDEETKGILNPFLYLSKFGSLGEFKTQVKERCKRIGKLHLVEGLEEEERKTRKRYEDEELVRHYMEVKERIGGRIPSVHDMKKNSPPSVTTYINRYGSWSNFLRQVEPSWEKGRRSRKRKECLDQATSESDQTLASEEITPSLSSLTS